MTRFVSRWRAPRDPAAQREAMVADQLRTRGIRDERVLAAMAAVPREAFVPEEARSEAYADEALPIGSGQTISQPYMVARMTELLDVEPGTGSSRSARAPATRRRSSPGSARRSPPSSGRRA